MSIINNFIMAFLFRSRRVSYRKIWLPTVILSLGLACGKKQSGGDNQQNSNTAKTDEQTISVTTGKSEAREIPAYIQATGSLIAEETSDIAPKTAGRVVNVYANVGQFVKQGALIAQIDDKDAKQQLAQAQASVAQTVSGVRQAEARLGLTQNGTFTATTIPEVRASNASYEQAVALLRQAEANEARYRDLVQTGDVAMITYETYRTQRDTARAAVNAAKQQQEAAVNAAKQNNQAIKSAQAAVDAAKVGVANAQQAITDTAIRAPFPGYISNRPTAVGEYVSSASIVATILRTNPIKAQMQIAEADVPYIKLGSGVSIQLDAYKDRNFGGTVTAVNPAIDPTTRSAIVEAQFENNDNALRSGMFATARITRQGGSQGVFVPKAAVYRDESTQSYRVFVVQENIVKLRTIQLGTEESDSYQILNGVNADETVATSNLDKLFEGAKVSS